ncbi:MAG TPA: hypothetical protein VFG65_01825 [Fimbriimonadales bacterium]|jgi:hypothetical protein|nr:hypothetical protein [Fimbriimonadales bacterium]
MSSITIVNLTPHALDFLDGENDAMSSVAPSGQVARCAETTEVVGKISIGAAKVDIVRKSYGELDGLPPAKDGTVYVASNLVMQAACAMGRHDVFCPADLIRDESGRIVGCRALAGMAEK